MTICFDSPKSAIKILENLDCWLRRTNRLNDLVKLRISGSKGSYPKVKEQGSNRKKQRENNDFKEKITIKLRKILFLQNEW